GWEPIIMARKPFRSTVAANVLEYGTGALNIDGCRIGTDTSRGDRYNGKTPGGTTAAFQMTDQKNDTWDVPSGRWPANVLLDEDAAAMLDEQSGLLAAGNHPRVRNTSGYSGGLQQGETGHSGVKMDTGGASRFFFTARSDGPECLI